MSFATSLRAGFKMAPVLILVGAGLAAWAQEEYRQIVRDIQVRHTGAVEAGDAGYVLTHTTARRGGYVSQRDLSRDQRALLDTGLFADVRVLLEPVDDGVRVIYEVSRRLRVQAPIIISGNERFKDKKVREFLDLTPGEFVDAALLAARCDRIRAEYRKRHYPDARVTAAATPLPGGLATVTIQIEEGRRQRIAGYAFRGNRAVDDATLRGVLGQPSRFNPFRVFYSSWRTRADEFGTVADAIRQLYLNRGHLDVQVAPRRLVEEDRETVRIQVTIDEGPVYTVEDLQITGVTLFPRAELAAAASVAIRPGSVASRSAIQRASRILRDYYGQRGYVDTLVRASTIAARADDPKMPGVILRFDVQEGVLAHVRHIAIRGNTRTRDKVIRREIGLVPGAVLDEVQAERSRLRLENLGYFESVRFYEVPDRDNPALRDVVYEVAEKNTGQLMLGVGFSSDENIIGFVEVSQANFDVLNWPYFHGGGQKLRASLELGSESRNIELSLTEPWFLDRRLSLSAEAFRRERNYDEYDVIRMGGGLGLTVPLVIGRANFRYVFEKIQLDDPLEGDYVFAETPARTYRFSDEADDYFNAPFRVSWLYDTRNRAFVPTRGTRGTIFAEVSGPWTGSDVEIYKVGTEFRHWMPLWSGHVLSLLVRAESVDTYGADDRVPIGDRLFLGGGRSVRGFRYRDIGPKVIPAEAGTGRYRPVGGQTMAMASAEYTIPFFKILRLAGFYDVGGVWTDAFDVDPDRLASSYGFGIRFDIPGFPIRLDYAIPIDYDDDYTRSERFVLWIGFE
jgi:outer membrane protein insertion porin family